MLFRRSLCTQAAARRRRRIQWPVKQVTKSNYSEALAEIKACILNSDYVAVSFQKTGGHSAPWHKILPIDTAETAYFKAKHAAERFQILQFAVCPFSVKASKLIAHPYNFHLFPRDELKVGMPSYSFSCQSSYLTAMAQEGFDFNACIYNGISYLSKAQELATNVQTGHLSPSSCTVQSSSAHSVADSLFTERIRSRVKNWIRACKDSNKTEDALISSLRKLISGSEVYGSRPSLNIDVCSERQVKLALETLKEFVDVVPLQLPKKGAGVQAVRAVLTSSQEDKNLLEKELQDMEQEQRERVLGFREEIGPFEKMNNMPAAISYLERRFSGSIDMDISSQDTDNVNIHGHNVLRVCHLFVKLCSILKISPEVPEDGQSHLSASLQRHSNIFNPCSSNSRDPIEDDVRIWTGKSRTVSIDNLVFLWGFKSGISARSLKDLLCDSHDVFSEEFDVRMVDRTCAVVVFWTPGFAECFLRITDAGEIISTKLTGLISEGLKAAGYETYRRVCEPGLWKSDLADCLDQAMETEILSGAIKSQQEQPVIDWNNDEMINLNDL
ncbi:UNVERIFIED_CONTAM: Poly(A)-specific ribonuclease PARN-like [Sesamum latifolium]|uniref:Poly(A)-specific ribonuclease PARN-like n=1 Tax=Sesamum latifolium TaxID=2727402 RepID=A0AAW2Y3W5_9LAMI